MSFNKENKEKNTLTYLNLKKKKLKIRNKKD